MIGQIKERCIYCGSDVYYNGTETLIKCGMCGHTLVVAKFENELASMKQALEEGEQARKDLAAAEKARQDAQVRLQETLGSFDEIKDRQDVLSLLIKSVITAQNTAEEKLTQVRDITDRILKSQGDIIDGMAIFGEIRDNLQEIGLNAQAQKDFAKNFVNWFQDIHADDVGRLNLLHDQSSMILAEQKEISVKVDSLHQVAEDTKEKIDAFQNQYTQDKLVELRQLYRQAQNYQFDRAYDKAFDKYEQIVLKGGNDAAVLWHMILCHYCVSYQENDDGIMVPTILNPDLTDPDEMSLRLDFENLLNDPSMVTEAQAEIYRSELHKIDTILDDYRHVKHELDYDIFISVKQDEEGHFTYDSDVAGELYHFLTAKGYKVFNSRISRIPAGEEYEPYIISALLSARVMIVVGTRPENMNAVWVKNEWSRFQWIQQSEKRNKGTTDRLLLCYLAKPMKPKDLPRALNPNRQAIVEGVDSGAILLETLDDVFRRGKSGQKDARPEEKPSKPVSEIVNAGSKTTKAALESENTEKAPEKITDAGVKDLPESRFKFSKPMIVAGAVVGLIALCFLILPKISGDRNKAPVETKTQENLSAESTAESASESAAEPETYSLPGYDLSDYVTLGQYRDLTYSAAAYETVTVSEAEVDDQIKSWLESEPDYTKITDRPAQNGDTVVIDFEGTINGNAFAGSSAEDYALELGSGTFIDGFEDGLIGVYPGDTVSLDLTFPEDYANSDVSGKQATFVVTLHYIRGSINITDRAAKALASSQNIGKANTLAELRERVREWLETRKSDEIKRIKCDDLLAAATENAQIKQCPEELLTPYKDYYENFYKYFAGLYGMELNEFFESTGMTEEDFENMYQSEAEKTLVACAIAEEEGIVLDDKIYDEELKKFSNLEGISVEEIETGYSKEYLKYQFLCDLVGEFLVDHARAM